MEQEKQLILTLVEMTDRGKQQSHILLLLALHLGRGMLASSSEVRAIVGTVDFHEPLGRAAHRTNRLVERWAGSTALALTAGRAGHTPASHRRPGMDNEVASWVSGDVIPRLPS
jgi:hypothetical protein